MDISINKKIWINHNNCMKEIIVLDVMNEGALIEYSIPYNKGRLSFFKHLFNSYTTIEKMEDFKKKIIK